MNNFQGIEAMKNLSELFCGKLFLCGLKQKSESSGNLGLEF